jgi:hypothetical protein
MGWSHGAAIDCSKVPETKRYVHCVQHWSGGVREQM